MRRLRSTGLLASLAILLASSFAVTFGQTALDRRTYLPLVARAATPAPTATFTPTATPSSTPIPPHDLANENSIAEQINQQRASYGFAPVTLVSELTQASRRHSRDMADSNFTSHTGSDGSDGGSRMRAAGYGWSTWGEIIGWGFGGNTASMVNWWMNSSTHRAIILSSSFVDFGVGYARNLGSSWGHYWTVNFGRRSGAAAASQAPYTCTFTLLDVSGGSSLIVQGHTPCREIMAGATPNASSGASQTSAQW